jgi:hypothetical protein
MLQPQPDSRADVSGIRRDPWFKRNTPLVIEAGPSLCLIRPIDGLFMNPVQLSPAGETAISDVPIDSSLQATLVEFLFESFFSHDVRVWFLFYRADDNSSGRPASAAPPAKRQAFSQPVLHRVFLGLFTGLACGNTCLSVFKEATLPLSPALNRNTQTVASRAPATVAPDLLLSTAEPGCLPSTSRTQVQLPSSLGQSLGPRLRVVRTSRFYTTAPLADALRRVYEACSAAVVSDAGAHVRIQHHNATVIFGTRCCGR